MANVTYRHIEMKELGEGITLTQFYHNTASGEAPVFRNISFRNISGTVSGQAGQFMCLPESPCVNITLEDVVITGFDMGYECENAYGHATNSEPESCLITL